MRGRDGTSNHSKRMKEVWASGKYANRRPKGQGLKHGNASVENGDMNKDEDLENGDDYGSGYESASGDLLLNTDEIC